MRRMTTTSTVRGRLLLPQGVLDDGVVVVEADRIAWVGPASQAPGEIPDRADGTVLPGLVDLHCHGGGGASFPDATNLDEVRTAVEEHARHGTTTLLASLVTDTRDTMLARTALMGEAVAAGLVAGVHVEGPFLAPARAGAQVGDLMTAGDAGLVTELARVAGGLACVTMAPEVPAVLDEVLPAVIAAGAVPAFGHTDASAEQIREALDRALDEGRVPLASHLFNGMRPLHHRDPGPIPVLLTAARAGEVVVELIADGVHVAPQVVAMVFDMVGPDAIALVTDAMAGAGMPDGHYPMGPSRVWVTGGVSRLVRGGTIAGGTGHLLDVVRCAVAAGVSLPDAVRAASATPARVLGRADLGRLEPGARADLLVVDDDLVPTRVMRAGSWLAAVA